VLRWSDWRRPCSPLPGATGATSFITGIVDLTRRGGTAARLLDVINDRSAWALAGWMTQRTDAWPAGIGVAALDPYRGYACALRASLPHAVRVLDAFPVVRLGCAAVDQVRCRIQREQTGHRGRTHDPLYQIRRLLRRAAHHHTPTVLGTAAGRAGCRRHPR
jgi:transposase